MSLDAELYCGQCGQPLTADHARCEQRAELEPPRYCPYCARRMVVQVDPLGWRAECSRHGERRG
jgi:DNA-directed RNA polymerase subunit RPC12/RpoP